jgi:hypothetical protein
VKEKKRERGEDILACREEEKELRRGEKKKRNVGVFFIKSEERRKG